MSYDLRVSAPGGLDLGPLLAAGAEKAGGELVWARETLVAQFLPSGDALEVGVVGHEGSPAQRAREFRDLLELLLIVAGPEGAVHDAQLGRDLSADDVGAAAAGFS
jgi:hypothetical protein